MRADLLRANGPGYNAGNARSAQKTSPKIGDPGHPADRDGDRHLCRGALLAQYSPQFSMETALSGC